jgi:sirohydrochlorin ferrochelatase
VERKVGVDPTDQAAEQAAVARAGEPAAPAQGRVIVIVDHGSRSSAANEVVAEVSRLVQIRAGAHVAVRFAHMEICEPSLPTVIDDCVSSGARLVTVQPLFLAPGKHASRDIPELVADAQRRHPTVRFELGCVIGADPLLAEIVAARCGLG